MDDHEMTTADLLETRLRETLEDLDLSRYGTIDEESIKPTLEKLKVLQTHHLELKKLEAQTELKKQEMMVELQKLELEKQKLETQNELKRKELDEEEKKLQIEFKKVEDDTAIRIRDLELKDANDKKNAELEAAKAEEQKKANRTNAIIGGASAATGLLGIWATLHCVKGSFRFEETGSFTNKTGQHVGSMMNLFRRR